MAGVEKKLKRAGNLTGLGDQQKPSKALKFLSDLTKSGELDADTKALAEQVITQWHQSSN